MSKIRKYSLTSILLGLLTFVYTTITKAQQEYVQIKYGPLPPSRSEIVWIIAKLLGIIIAVVIAPIAGISWYISRKKRRRWFDSVIWSIVCLMILATIIILLINAR